MEASQTAEMPLTTSVKKFIGKKIPVSDFKFNCCFSESAKAILVFSFAVKTMEISYSLWNCICHIDVYPTGSVIKTLRIKE